MAKMTKQFVLELILLIFHQGQVYLALSNKRDAQNFHILFALEAELSKLGKTWGLIKNLVFF
jgi:hypothetical protein